MDRLNGKTVIVTGGAVGIGRACVERMAGEGYQRRDHTQRRPDAAGPVQRRGPARPERRLVGRGRSDGGGLAGIFRQDRN